MTQPSDFASRRRARGIPHRSHTLKMAFDLHRYDVGTAWDFPRRHAPTATPQMVLAARTGASLSRGRIDRPRSVQAESAEAPAGELGQ
jgi:hypothetical protein